MWQNVAEGNIKALRVYYVKTENENCGSETCQLGCLANWR